MRSIPGRAQVERKMEPKPKSRDELDKGGSEREEGTGLRFEDPRATLGPPNSREF